MKILTTLQIKLDDISPIRPDKCPPTIENSDNELRIMCYSKARSIYGENLPNNNKRKD